jgi:hypothetical protein
MSNYRKIAEDNVARFYRTPAPDRAVRIGAVQEQDAFCFTAFGRRCRISPAGIELDGRPEHDVLAVLISLYALYAAPVPCIVEPLKSFKQLPDSMPYAAAFSSRTQQSLVPRVDAVEKQMPAILAALAGEAAPADAGADFGFLVYPLPKIALCYLFYREDEDFPASVTCLYAANAASHLPTDALADVGEYTSKAIAHLLAQ